jgi:predicted nucleic acid-binding protein
MVMTAKAIDVRTYTFRKDDRLLLDANIWLSVYGPIACHDWRTDVYSKALSRIYSSKCLIFLDAIVLSEYINRFARLEYEQMDKSIKPSTYKEFRSSVHFKNVASEVAITVNNILKKTTCCNFDFESIKTTDILVDYQAGTRDFSDSLIIELCKEQDLVLITHDKDFKNCDIPILTAHKRLLN